MTTGHTAASIGRPLRVLLMANNGLGAGHVTRALAVARALRRRAQVWGLPMQVLLATTSEADALLAWAQVPCVRWPTPGRARDGGWSDGIRRALASRVLAGAIDGFRPDLLVTDTFPLGPHGELQGHLSEVRHRVLIRRSVRADRAGEAPLRSGLDDYQLAITPHDPAEHSSESLPIPSLAVPPITLFEAVDGASREEARARLGIPADVRAILVCAGGGGDEEAAQLAALIADVVARTPHSVPVLAAGPLGHRSSANHLVVRECPLQPWLAAFDGAIVAAGYNLAHELAKAQIPLALFARPRPYDDQADRARRFHDQGLARVLAAVNEGDVADALTWMAQTPRAPGVAAGGADQTADALLRLVTGRGQP